MTMMDLVRKFSGMGCAILILLFALSFAREAESAPSVYPTGLTIKKLDKAQPGYTVYCVYGEDKIFVLDMDGKEVHTWDIPGLGANIKPLSNGHVLVLMRADGDSSIQGSDTLREYDWEGKQVWEFAMPKDFKNLHHDFHLLPNGNILALGSRMRTIPAIPRQVRDDVIFEVDRDKNIVWEWSTLDHYDQLALSDATRAYIAKGIKDADIFHTNSIQALPPNGLERTDYRFKRGNIIVSQRDTSLVFIIDKSTGNIVWTLQQKTVGQHHVSMIPSKLNGAGHIILFDNGGYSGYPNFYRLFSKVMEINLKSNRVAWQYTGNSTDNRPLISFFSTFRSGIQRLRNGNTLITESDWGRIFEVTSSGEIVWEYINPYFRNMSGNFSNGYTNLIYRAYRVDLDWEKGSAGISYW